jgi:hypothetical protein
MQSGGHPPVMTATMSPARLAIHVGAADDRGSIINAHAMEVQVHRCGRSVAGRGAGSG